MANYNKVILIGNLTRDPQLTYTPSNTAIAEFGMAINRNWTGQDGQKREEVCFVDITAFGKQAETINTYLSKGRQIMVEGRLNLQQWQAQDGSKRSKLSVVVEGFQFLGGGNPNSEGGSSEGRAPMRNSAPQSNRPPQPRRARDEFPPDTIPEPAEDFPQAGADDDIPF